MNYIDLKDKEAVKPKRRGSTASFFGHIKTQNINSGLNNSALKITFCLVLC